MRYSWLNILFFTAICCCATGVSMAQRPAVLPIEPIVPKVQPVASTRQWVDFGSSSANKQASISQPAATYQQLAPQPDPLYILNSQVIIGNGLRNIMPNDIEKLYVYKGAETPWKWRSLTNYGIIDITLKDKSKTRLETKTLTQISKGLNLTGPVSYFINGMPVGEADLRIATAAISEVKVTRATPVAPTTLVDIQIARYISPPPAPDPSGKPRIMIRGTAAL